MISNISEPFEDDHSRVSEGIAIRATLRLKLPLGPIDIWGGITGGTYSSTVRYTELVDADIFNSYSIGLIGASYMAGINYLIKDKKENTRASVTFFADFLGPKIKENIVNTVNLDWNFENPIGNRVMSPVRFGLSIGIHLLPKEL